MNSKEPSLIERINTKKEILKKEKSEKIKNEEELIKSIYDFIDNDHFESRLDSLKELIVNRVDCEEDNVKIKSSSLICNDRLFDYLDKNELKGYDFIKSILLDYDIDYGMTNYNGVSVKEINKAFNNKKDFEDILKDFKLKYRFDQSIPFLAEMFSLEQMNDSDINRIKKELKKEKVDMKVTKEGEQKIYEFSW